MLNIGLTGNIGSGKTLVSELFKELGIPVFHADTEAKKLFEDDRIRERIRELFGNEVFSVSGKIISSKLAEIVFNDREKLDWLNSIIHPEVRRNYGEWCRLLHDAPYNLYEAAILYESGHYLEMDRVICVVAPEELRIRRVMERDDVTREEVIRRMANQWPEERKAAMADFVINNDSVERPELQVKEVHQRLVG